MKIWLFALLQSIIASLGLAAFFLANNVVLATAAAVMAASLGIAQPLISAYKGRKLEVYQDQQWDRSVDVVDEQVEGLLAEVIAPPAPHRATVALVAKSRFGTEAAELMEQFDRAVEATTASSPGAEAVVVQFADDVKPWSVGAYLLGLTAWSAGNIELAREHFCIAKQEQPSWILPWLGWAATAHQQSRWDELRGEHPHVCGVELLPYGAGDEATFIGLSADDREALTDSFQRAATSLGNYYTIAELSNSKQQMATSREEYKKVA